MSRASEHPDLPTRASIPASGGSAKKAGIVASQRADPGMVDTLRRLSRSAGIFAMALGALVLLGWMRDIQILKSVAPGLVSMKANTAVAFVLSGYALWALHSIGSARISRAAMICSISVIAIGLLTLSEYLFGWNLGIDYLLFEETGNAVKTSVPERMSPATALSFILLGAALCCLALPNRECHCRAQSIALAVLVASAMATIGHVYGVHAQYGVVTYTWMAVHAAIAFVIVSLGILFFRPDYGWIALIASDNTGGAMIRRLWLPSVGTLLVFGWLELIGKKAGWYSSEFGASLFVIIAVTVLTVLMWRNARSLDRTDAQREYAEAEKDRLNAELEQRVAERTAELVAANSELASFSYSVSHDLRAPLRSIDSFANIVLREYGENLPAEAQHCLSRVCANVQRMNQLIDDLLKLSRFARQPISRITVPIEALVRDCLEQLHADQGERLIEYKIGNLRECQADPSLLRTVFLNLLGNALKYTRSRERAVIEVGVHEDGAENIFYVKDNGVGFDMKYADRMFGVFQRLHGEDEYEGNGVGLAIVQRVVHRHGGRVWAESETGHGATFYFTLGAGPS